MKSIHDYTLSELEDLYIEKIKEAEEAGKEWVGAKAEFESIEDKRKPELSRLMGESNQNSISAREQEAYSHKEWGDFLGLVASTRKTYLRFQVIYDMAKLKIEAIRTIISTRRQEIASFRG